MAKGKQNAGGVVRLTPRIGDLVPLNLIELLHINAVLKNFNGNIAEAARVLGINQATIYRRRKAAALKG